MSQIEHFHNMSVPEIIGRASAVSRDTNRPLWHCIAVIFREEAKKQHASSQEMQTACVTDAINTLQATLLSTTPGKWSERVKTRLMNLLDYLTPTSRKTEKPKPKSGDRS
jgi:hypothetical protein